MDNRQYQVMMKKIGLLPKIITKQLYVEKNLIEFQIAKLKLIKKEVKKMIGISVAAKKEWEATLNYFGLTHEECEKYP